MNELSREEWMGLLKKLGDYVERLEDSLKAVEADRDEYKALYTARALELLHKTPLSKDELDSIIYGIDENGDIRRKCQVELEEAGCILPPPILMTMDNADIPPEHTLNQGANFIPDQHIPDCIPDSAITRKDGVFVGTLQEAVDAVAKEGGPKTVYVIGKSTTEKSDDDAFGPIDDKKGDES